MSWSKVDNGSRLLNWKRCTDAIWKPRPRKKESTRRWPIAYASCFWIGFHLWPRLTRYRKWKGPKEETLDGTNNASERAIAGAIKERYRTMRGYKVPENAVGVSRLLAWCGNFLNAENGAVLAEIL